MKRSKKVLKRIDRLTSRMDISSQKDTMEHLKQLTLLLLIFDDDTIPEVSTKLDEIEKYLDLIENKSK